MFFAHREEGGERKEKQLSKVNVVGGWYEMITETVWFNWFNRFKLKSINPLKPIKSDLVNCMIKILDVGLLSIETKSEPVTPHITSYKQSFTIKNQLAPFLSQTSRCQGRNKAQTSTRWLPMYHPVSFLQSSPFTFRHPSRQGVSTLAQCCENRTINNNSMFVSHRALLLAGLSLVCLL